MIYSSQIDVEAHDGSVHKLRVVWIDEPHYSSKNSTREPDSTIWRAFRVTDMDTGEELFRISANRFQSYEKRKAFTVAPCKTELGGHP